MATDATYPAGYTQLRQDGSLDVEGTLLLSGTAVTATATQINQVAAMFGTVNADRAAKIAKVALTALDTGGGVFAWANPEAGYIIVEKVIIDVTTVATGACTVAVGTTAVSASTSSNNLIDGFDAHSATGLFGVADGSTGGKAQQKLATGKWVTGSKASGAAAGLVGYAYIKYIVV